MIIIEKIIHSLTSTSWLHTGYYNSTTCEEIIITSITKYIFLVSGQKRGIFINILNKYSENNRIFLTVYSIEINVNMAIICA